MVPTTAISAASHTANLRRTNRQKPSLVSCPQPASRPRWELARCCVTHARPALACPHCTTRFHVHCTPRFRMQCATRKETGGTLGRASCRLAAAAARRCHALTLPRRHRRPLCRRRRRRARPLPAAAAGAAPPGRRPALAAACASAWPAGRRRRRVRGGRRRAPPPRRAACSAGTTASCTRTCGGQTNQVNEGLFAGHDTRCGQDWLPCHEQTTAGCGPAPESEGAGGKQPGPQRRRAVPPAGAAALRCRCRWVPCRRASARAWHEGLLLLLMGEAEGRRMRWTDAQHAGVGEAHSQCMGCTKRRRFWRRQTELEGGRRGLHAQPRTEASTWTGPHPFEQHVRSQLDSREACVGRGAGIDVGVARQGCRGVRMSTGAVERALPSAGQQACSRGSACSSPCHRRDGLPSRHSTAQMCPGRTPSMTGTASSRVPHSLTASPAALTRAAESRLHLVPARVAGHPKHRPRVGVGKAVLPSHRRTLGQPPGAAGASYCCPGMRPPPLAAAGGRPLPAAAAACRSPSASAVSRTAGVGSLGAGCRLCWRAGTAKGPHQARPGFAVPSLLTRNRDGGLQNDCSSGHV